MTLTVACVHWTPSPGEAFLWQPPPAPSDAAALDVAPRALAVRLGERVELALSGYRANEAVCIWEGGGSRGSRIRIAAADRPGLRHVRCRAGETELAAQITYTEAERLPVSDPYAGGVVLLKTRRTPRDPKRPEGRSSLGLGSLDQLLQGLGARTYPAFPFDRSGTRDRVGLSRWLAVEIPEGVNFYQAVELLRADRNVYPESYLPVDGAYLRVGARRAWPTPLTSPRSGARPAAYRQGKTMPTIQQEAVAWDLRAMGAPAAWQRGDGQGVAIAVVDTGVDVNHLSVAPNLRIKDTERFGSDGDGNGIPGDAVGVNFAHLAIATRPSGGWLGLGLRDDLSDWSGSGTAIAALAAGAGGPGGRLGVAPGAQLLVVDTEENARIAPSALLAGDPRMPDPPSHSLRRSVWAKAAGVVYAVAEGARVLTCAWEPQEPHWLLHDALRFAEDNCAVAVCSVVAGGQASDVGYPVRWQGARRSADGFGAGEVLDVWSGGIEPDFLLRPLEAMIVAGELPAQARSQPGDLIQPAGPARGRALRSAVSNPRNDHTPLPDRRTDVFSGPITAVGLVAGAAALVTQQRPDLEPGAVRDALLHGLGVRGPEGPLWLPDALDAASALPAGACRPFVERLERALHDREPWWKRRSQTRIDLESSDGSPPASPEEP